MANRRLDALYKRQNTEIHVNVQVLTWTEDSVVFYYSPSLDITGYGNTDEEAKNSFEIFLNEFIDYTNNKKTIYEELERLGWTVNKNKKRIHPPTDLQLQEDNEAYRDVLTKENVKREDSELSLSLV